NRGQVVGVSYNLPPGGDAPDAEGNGADAAAFLWERGVLTDLGPGEARAINHAGDIAGSHNGRAFLFRAGFRIDLGTLGGRMTALSLNECGEVVGSAEDWRGRPRAFLRNGHGLYDLGTLGGQRSSALGMRATRVVGWSETADAQPTRRAFLYWLAGPLIDLNWWLPPGSGWVLQEAVALNPQGEVVGRGLYNGRPAWFLLRKEAGTPVIELPVRDGELVSMNNVGQMAGQAVAAPQGQVRAILLTPR
ncbi:MAG TPA: hypothetical protein VHN78_10720, partial [Chloroflexota bacterium]|nr:hypothetical protein [Chloroflexota bacterium]